MKIRKLFNNYSKELLIIFLIFLLDRISKLYVIYLDSSTMNSLVYSSKFLNIHLIWNEGIAFGLFSFFNSYYYNILTVLILFVIFVILFFLKNSSGFKKISLILILAGALGNFFDRVYYQAVPDFIDLHFGDFHWFIFNIADIFISIGVISMILLEFTDKQKK